jgi:hypothetical protein
VTRNDDDDDDDDDDNNNNKFFYYRTVLDNGKIANSLIITQVSPVVL